jgi:hypothetical protein
MTKDRQNEKRSDLDINAAIRLYEQAFTLLGRRLSEQALDIFLQLIDQAASVISFIVRFVKAEVLTLIQNRRQY